MESKIKNLVDTSIVHMNLFCADVVLDKEFNQTVLRIFIDRENEIVDLDTIVDATRVISKLLDEHEFIRSQYSLEVSTIEKGGK